MSSPRTATIAVIQTTLNADVTTNVAKISELVSKAAHQGAQIILPPELFEGPYFCREEQDRFFAWAQPVENHPTIIHFQHLAEELNVVIPISFFERSGQVYYNSLAMIDADGSLLGVYRKSHIPDGPGYEEKFYFREGDTGFKVWDTAFGKIGVGICWDQWFPECARAMVLMGAEILLYPTAIGSEPEEPDLNTKDPWQRAMIGHAVSNVIPVAAANRIGLEGNQTFYGHSFIANHRGDKVAEFTDRDEGVILASFDLNQIRLNRASFGFFRDRRPDLYQVLLSP
ncbi:MULTISPECIES: N-carbamoylputrescine amidase [Pseudanabaena]|uniref:N-carbamoylputrescine amidase n=2 Tax=Pseudanabaena TaxID=1152 RepID=L8MZH3_9CYAN|nr:MULTISPECIES: N-carbamoylputrescine amidase [Pseudanabaena]ELS31388.1 N-carbamoylputrescine amidase [Pseudanabaena biceps PCC 7429]MDG3496353.1 N-carbamoylputrescine amidase [Pseudanabaena catenata USMAC16]